MDETSPSPKHEDLSGERNLPTIEVGMSKNELLVNGKVLEPADGAEILQRALTEGKDVIMQGLEDYKRHKQQFHPAEDVALSPFSVVFLGTKKSKILTKLGQQLAVNEQVLNDLSAIREEFHSLWEAVERSGFIPDVRVYFPGPQWDIRLWAKIPVTEEDIGQQTPVGNT